MATALERKRQQKNETVLLNTYSFTFAATLGTAIIMMLIATISWLAAQFSSHFRGLGQFNAILQVYTLTHSRTQVALKLTAVLISYSLEASLLFVLSLIGIRHLICPPKQKKQQKGEDLIQKLSPFYFTVLGIAVMTNVAVITWSRLEALSFSQSNSVLMLQQIQQDIRPLPNQPSYLNQAGRTFQQLQSQLQCCGVFTPYEWPDRVNWFRQKYSNSTGYPLFPCSSTPEQQLFASSCSWTGAPTPDCTFDPPLFTVGCADQMRRVALDSLCRLSRISLVLIVLEVFQFVWMVYLCHTLKSTTSLQMTVVPVVKDTAQLSKH